MKKIILIVSLLVSVLLYQSCGTCNKAMGELTGYSKECVEGVMYYQFPSGVAVAYNQDGTIRLCK